MDDGKSRTTATILPSFLSCNLVLFLINWASSLDDRREERSSEFLAEIFFKEHHGMITETSLRFAHRGCSFFDVKASRVSSREKAHAWAWAVSVPGFGFLVPVLAFLELESKMLGTLGPQKRRKHLSNSRPLLPVHSCTWAPENTGTHAQNFSLIVFHFSLKG
jgi:hypothetical protein